MKKLLLLLGAVGLTATSACSVIACGVTSGDKNKNPNYVGIDEIPLVEQKISIEQALLARLRTVILDNEYGLSDNVYTSYSLNQNAKDLTGLERYKDKTMLDVYKDFFGSTKLSADAIDYQNIALNGRLGEKGDIFNLLLKSVGNQLLPPNLVKGLTTVLKLLGFGDLVKKVDDFLANFAPNAVNLSEKVIQILQSLNLSTVANGIPLGIGMIKGKEVSDADLRRIQNLFLPLLTSIIKQTSVDQFFTSLAGAINFDFNSYAISDLTSIFSIEISNAVQAFSQETYEPLTYSNDSDEIQTQTIKAGQFLGTYLMSTEKTPTTKNLWPGIVAGLKAFNALSLKMTILNSETKSFVPIDANHLFSEDDNATYLNQMFGTKQKVSENPLVITQPSLAQFFNFGELFSNLVYFFDNALDEATIINRHLKFFNVFFADRVTDQKIGSQAAFFLAGVLSKTNPGGGIGTDPAEIGETAQQLDQIFTNSFLTNRPIDLPSDPSSEFLTNLVAWLKTDDEFLATPFQTSYDGDLTAFLAAEELTKVIGEDFWKMLIPVLGEIFNYQKDHHANIKNLFNSQLISILIAAGAKNYGAPDLIANNGLFPNYAAYYTDKTLVQIINELKGIFNVSGREGVTDLVYRYFDVKLFNQVFDQILYKIDDQESLLTMIIVNWKNPDQILTNLGYLNVVDPENPDDPGRYAIKIQSWMGQLLQCLAPDLTNNHQPDGVVYLDEIEGPAKNYTDNFHAFARQIAEILTQLIKPTDYKYWIKPIFNQEDAFKVDEESDEWTIRHDDIYKGVVYLTFDPNGIVVLDDPYPKVVLKSDKIVYRVFFSRNHPGQQYTINKIEKIVPKF